MKFRNLIGVLIALISCSCVQLSSSSKVQTQKKLSQHLVLDSGIRIENGPIQGLSYSNSLGIEFGHAYSSNTIYNDSTVSIHLQIDLSKEYTFPVPFNDKKFKVVTWPQELALNRVTKTESLSKELLNFFQNESDTINYMNITIEPNEKVVLTTGTLFDKSTNYYVSPDAIYIQRDGSISGDCENLLNRNKLTNASFALGLRLTMPMPVNACAIISFGQISFANN